MKNITLLLLCFAALSVLTSFANAQLPASQENPVTLKQAFKDKFFIGTALTTSQLRGSNPQAIEVVREHFNSIVAENSMKSMHLQPREGEFAFREADRVVGFGETHGMKSIGHTLIWHSEAPKWFCVDQSGQDVSRGVLIERIRSH